MPLFSLLQCGAVKVFFTGIFLMFSVANSTCSARSLEFNEVKPQFGPVEVGKAGEPKIISILNVSRTPIFLLNIAATQDFSASTVCPMWLAEGSGCLVFVTFAPTAAGTRTGELIVSVQETDPQSITLTGIGLPSSDKRAGTLPPSLQETRSTNNEELARELLGDRRYTFEALLNGNPADVANSEKVFTLTNDADGKQRTAAILMSVGIKDEVYLDYLTGEAEKALKHDHDLPWPMIYGDDWLPKAFNPALNDWCIKHDLSFWDAYRVQYYQISNAWWFLAAAHDPRTYELFVKGLHSPNLIIVSDAAHGLAALQDPRAIDEMIAIGRQVPGEARGAIAVSLLFFAEPRAQKAAEELMPETEKHMLEAMRKEMKEKGLKAILPW